MKEVVFSGLLIAVLVGTVSGLYLAFYLSRFNPVVVRKGLATGGSGGSFRKALVLVQFTISVLMIIGTLIVSGQLKFMKTTDLGFDKDDIMVMTVRDTTLRISFESFREEIMTHPEILEAAQSNSNPGSIVGIVI